MSPLATGCGSVWLERSVRDAEAARSNRAIPTIKKQTGSSEAGARFLFPKSGMCSLLCGACACDAGGRRCLASKRHSCRPAYAVCGSGCRGDPRGGAAGTLLPSIAAPFFVGHIRCPGLLCCSLPGGSECGERDCLAPSAIPEAGRQAAAFAQKMIFCAKVFDRTGRLLYIAFHNALVAQLDRATGYEPVGQEFESLRAHHANSGDQFYWPPFLLCTGLTSGGLHQCLRPVAARHARRGLRASCRTSFQAAGSVRQGGLWCGPALSDRSGLRPSPP